VRAFASLSEVVLTVDELVINDLLRPSETAADIFVDNALRQLLPQIFRALGNSDVIGNPVGLINRLGTGTVY
jgi:hypothetical protein